MGWVVLLKNTAESFKYSLFLVSLMQEIVVKLDMPEKFEHEFKLALARVVESLVKEIEFSMVNGIISKSKLTKEDALKLAKDVNKGMHKELKKLHPELL